MISRNSTYQKVWEADTLYLLVWKTILRCSTHVMHEVASRKDLIRTIQWWYFVVSIVTSHYRLSMLSLLLETESSMPSNVVVLENHPEGLEPIHKAHSKVSVSPEPLLVTKIVWVRVIQRNCSHHHIQLLLSSWNGMYATGGLNFNFCLILINFHLNSHILM